MTSEETGSSAFMVEGGPVQELGRRRRIAGGLVSGGCDLCCSDDGHDPVYVEEETSYVWHDIQSSSVDYIFRFRVATCIEEGC